jgi:hypothetical protein
MVGVTRQDVNEEIDRTCNVIKLYDLGQTERVLPEGIDIRLEVTYQPDRYHGLDTYPQAGRGDLGMEPADHTTALQQADSDQAGRSRQTNLAGNFLFEIRALFCNRAKIS